MTKRHKATIPGLSGTRINVTSYLLSLLIVILLVFPITEPVFADTDSWIQTSQADFEAGILDNADTTNSSGDLQLATSDYFIYALQGNDQQSFWRYDSATGNWSLRADTPEKVNGGGTIVYDGGNNIYALQGNDLKGFWRYDITTDNWTYLADAPENVNKGGAITYDSNNFIYALRGNDQKSFWGYDITTDNWTFLADAPAQVGSGGSLAFNSSDNCVYALRGDYKRDFWKYSISADNWTSMTNTPQKVKGGGALIHDGDGYIYALQGNEHNSFWRYTIASGNWTSMTVAPIQVGSGGALAFDGSSYVYAFQGNSQTRFFRYDINLEAQILSSWTSMADAPEKVKEGSALIHGNNRYLYALQGNNQKSFWRYDIVADNWTSRADAPATVNGSLVYDNNSYIYALRGNDQESFWRYDIPANFWLSLTDAPAKVKEGGALSYDGHSYIYALRGNDQKSFWRYDIAADNWTPLADTPEKVKDGGSLICNDDNYIYALRGNDQNSFWRYDIAGNSWTAVADTPELVSGGGSLVYRKSNYIYAFQGNSEKGYWRYDMAADSWILLADTPATVGAGGALTYDGSDYVYAFRGNDQKTFWRYDVAHDSLKELVWTLLTNAPGRVAAGGNLAYQGHPYVATGTFTSSIYDVGFAGVLWKNMTWQETLNGQTINVKVRTSRNPDMSRATEWDYCPAVANGSDISNLLSVYDGDHYIQYRVELSTVDASKTPVLHEITIGYSSHQSADQAPQVTEVSLYDSTRTNPVISMDPQIEYAVKISVTDDNQLADLQTLKVTLFYDADGTYDAGEVPLSGNTTSCYILAFTAGSLTPWAGSPTDNETTWALETAKCRQPDLSQKSGDFWFHFKPGKVASETTGPAKWHIYAVADDGNTRASAYQDNIDMNWYGEIVVDDNIIDWTSANKSGEYNIISGIPVTYISNGAYLEQVAASSSWDGEQDTAILDKDGNLEANELLIKANDIIELYGDNSAVSIASPPHYTTIDDSNVQTDESGNMVSTNSLWFDPGSQSADVAYSGIIYYCITR